MAVAVSVHGAVEAAADLDAMARRTVAMETPLAASARGAARSIRGIPVDTGRLDRSVRAGVRVTPHGYTVGTDVHYSRFVFGGTRYMRARPPQVPATVGPTTARASLRWITG